MRTMDDLIQRQIQHPLSRRGFLTATGSAAGMLLATGGLTEAQALRPTSGPTGTVAYLSSSNFIGSWNPYENLVLVHMRAQRMVYDYLMWIDNNGNFVPGLATSFENVSPTVWEVKLRRGVTFHDGQSFTASDVKASVELASNPQSVTGSLFPGQLTVQVVNDYTARIHTPEPFAALKAGTLCANQSAAIISHQDAAKGENWLKKRMNGTGPFKMVDYQGESGGLNLTANTHYWRGTPKVQNVNIKYVNDTTTRLAALLSGQADIVEALGPDEAKRLTNFPSVTLQHTTSTDSINLAFRTQTHPMNNVKLRQAISYAIDVPSIVKDIYGGYAVVNQSFGQPHTLGFKPDPNYFRYNPTRAKSLLAEAGYPRGHGLPQLTLIAPIGAYPKTQEYSQFIAQNLQTIGINVHLETMDETSWNDALFKKEGHMILHGWLVPTPDRNSWYTSLYRTTGLISFVNNARIDQAIKAQAQALDPRKRIALIQNQLEPALVSAVPEFPMFTYDLITGVSSKIHGLHIPHWYEFDMFPVSKS